MPEQPLSRDAAHPNANRTTEHATTSPTGLWRSARRLVGFAVGVDPRAYGMTSVVALAGSLAEGFGLVLLLPLLAAAGMSFAGASAAGRLAQVSQAVLLRTHLPRTLWLPVVLGVFLLASALRSVLRRTQLLLTTSTTTTVQLALSRRVYAAIVHAQWGYLVRQRAGSLTHLLTAELRQVADAVTLSLSLVNLGALTLVYLALAVKLSAAMTLLVVALGGALMMLQRRSLGRMRSSGQALADSVGEVFAATEEHLLNLKSVKTCDAEERDLRMFADLSRKAVRSSIASARHYALGTFRFELGSLLALGGVVFLALAVLHVQGATLLLLLAIFSRLMPQLASLQGQMHQFAGLLPSFERVLAAEAACVAHAESAAEAASPTVERLQLKQRLGFEDVWFSYRPEEPAPEWVLRGVRLTVEVGRLTALVGPSGVGKSTLADLVNGLLSPTRGRIMLDGTELTGAAMRQWRRQVGYVGQETVLFHQSLRANLLWAQPDATEAEIDAVLRLASAEFVYELPRGLDTIAGDRGILLSSGQRQRLALARALLRKPTLLLLDEATNALDEENEARILDALQNALQAAQGRLTVLMIAHRASAIRRADCVITLEGGNAVLGV